MVSENDNNQRRNVGRSQSSPLNVEQIKKQIEEGMNKEIEKKVSELVKKDIKKLLLDKEGRTPSESLGSEWRETLSGGTEKNEASKKDDNRGNRYNNRRQKTNDRENYPPLKDLREKDKEKREAKEKFQNKLSKINRQSIEDVKKNIKEKSRKIAERKKVVLQKKLKEKMKKKLTMNARKGKSLSVSCAFIVMLCIAFFSDVLLDIFVALTIQIVGLVISLTGVGAAVGLPVVAFIEAAGDIVDAVTGIILTIFSLAIGGHTKAGAKKGIKSLAKYVGAFVVELIPLLNLFTSWIVVTAWNWHEVRKRANEAEKMDEEINKISGS